MGLTAFASFSAWSASPITDSLGLDSYTNTAKGFQFNNLGTHGGVFSCSSTFCPGRLSSGEHHYLYFSPNDKHGKPTQSCVEGSGLQLQVVAPFTMSAWIRLDNFPEKDQVQAIASRWLGNGNRREWRFGVYADKKGDTRLFFERSTNGKGTADSSAFYHSDVALNGKFVRRWILVSFQIDAAGTSVFSLNGATYKAVRDYGPTGATIAAKGAAPRIGCTADYSENFVGLINSFQISRAFYNSKEIAATYKDKQRLYNTPSMIWDGSVPGRYSDGGRALELRGDYLFGLLTKMQSLNQDSFEALAGPFRTLQYESIFGPSYQNLKIAQTKINQVSRNSASPNVFLRDVLLPGEVLAKTGKLSARIAIASNLGRPKSSGDTDDCEDGSSFGDLQNQTLDNGKVYRGCFQVDGKGKPILDSKGRRVPFDRVGASKTAYGEAIQAEGLRMVDQLVEYKRQAPNAMADYYSEDDFLAPRKSQTMMMRKEFTLEVCRRLKTRGMTLHVKSYCGKYSGNENKYAAAGLLSSSDPELKSIGNKFDLLLLKRYVTTDTAGRLTDSEIKEIRDCVSSVTIYDQAHSVAVGVDDIVPWNSTTVSEMNSCVSYVRNALPWMKINIGIYSYSSDDKLRFTSKEGISNIDLARRVAADGYEFFGAPWSADRAPFEAGFKAPSSATDPWRINSDVLQYLMNNRLRNDLAPAQQQRVRFIDF